MSDPTLERLAELEARVDALEMAAREGDPELINGIPRSIVRHLQAIGALPKEEISVGYEETQGTTPLPFCPYCERLYSGTLEHHRGACLAWSLS